MSDAIKPEWIEAAYRAANAPDHTRPQQYVDAALEVVAPLIAAEARKQMAEEIAGEWGDKHDDLSDAITAAHPVHTKDHATFLRALNLISARHSKYALVGLVHYLLR